MHFIAEANVNVSVTQLYVRLCFLTQGEIQNTDSKTPNVKNQFTFYLQLMPYNKKNN